MENLTRELILKEQPGQRLDSWISEHVLTVPPLYCYSDIGGEVNIDYGSDGHKERIAVRDRAMADNLPNYSTQIADAWKIVEEFNSRGWPFFLEIAGDGRVKAGSGTRAANEIVYEEPEYSPTVPEAICKTALLLMVEREKEKEGNLR
jgi:hypothetical protein